MKNRFLILLLGVALGAGGSWMVFHRSPEPEEKTETAATTLSESKSDAPGVTLKPEQLAHAGLQTQVPQTVKLTEEKIGYAHVIDAATLLSAFAELELADVNFSAAEKEYLRLKQLHENGENASGQAVDAAALEMRRDQLQVSSDLMKLKTSWGSLASTDESRKQFADGLTAGGTLLRVDFSGADVFTAEGQKVSLDISGSDPTPSAQAEILGAATAIDAQFQGHSFWALLLGKTLPVGATFEATLSLGESAKTALTIPESALVRDQGALYVYIQTSPERFDRRHVEILQKGATSVALSGLAAADKVVTTGAQQLLSTEQGGEAQGD